MRKIAPIWLIFHLLGSAGLSQVKPYYFKNYQVGDGISSNTITCITQDSKGFMWFGTRNGLNRFDGYDFKTFSNNLNDSTSLGSNSIVSLQEDSRGRLWVGTHTGIYLFDPLKETFTPLRSIPQGETRFIREDPHHHLWIVSDFRLYCIQEGTGEVRTYGDGVVCLTLSKDGTPWVATNSGHLKKYVGDRFTDYPLQSSFRSLLQVQDIVPLGDDSVIIGTSNGAWMFNPKADAVRNIFSGYPWSDAIQIHKIFQHSDEEWWFATETGLIIYNTLTHKPILIQKEYENPYSITDNVLYSYYQDKEGGVWLGTFFGGVNYYSTQYNKFRKYFRHEGADDLSGNLVHEICEDRKGNLWIGTEDAGLNKIDAATGAIRHFLPGSGPGSISFKNVHGLIAVGNELWIGTYEHGLDVMDLNTEKVVRHYNAGTDSGSFKSNFVVTLYKTRGGDILVGTWNGMSEYNRQKNNFRSVPYFNTQIQAIHEDEEGTLWACTYGYGVTWYNAGTGRHGRLQHRGGDARSLINNYVNNFLEDSHKNLWFCTEGGLTKYNPRTGDLRNYTVADGFPDNQIFRALEDDAHNLWISSAKGLVCFDPVTGNIKTYTTSSGLLIDQFNYNSAYKRSDGTLFFGSIKGLISFNPSAFTQNTFIPPVYITGLQVDNKEVPIGAAGSPLKTSITYTHNITLPYNSSDISLNIAALSFAAPEMNRYAYQMEGLDKNWIQMNRNRKIYFTKLPQGDYTFKVKGSNNEGLWNEQEVTLSITVSPPWWDTAWAWTLYVLTALAIAFTIGRYYYLAIHEKNKRRIETLEIEKEREIYNAKIEFFTNVAHEIRTPLTLIKMPLDKLLRDPNHPAVINESLHMIEKNTNRLIDLTNQLLDFRKAEAGKIDLTFTETNIAELLKELFGNFRPAAEQRSLRYNLELPRMGLYAFVDPEALRKILSNLLNNAVKYAGTSILVKLLPFSSEDNNFHIEVRNDGFLIPPDEKEKIFQPFYRIKNTQREEGAGIGLPLSRSLAELHHGRLDLKQGEENVNVFLLSLPIHQEKEISLRDEPGPITEETPEEVAFDSAKPLLLLVEDNRDILQFIGKELNPSFNILSAANGQEALLILQKENVQLVVSDIMMPVMDGIALCKKIKTDLQYSHIPIILLTAKSSVSSKIEGLEVGADAYIEKPFNLEHLQAQIMSLLTNRNLVKEYFARSPLSHMKGMGSTLADRDFLEQLSDVIYEHITDMDLDVDQLSRLMNMSRTTLYRKISALSDLTPNELISLTRLKKAASMLAGGAYKINEVSTLVGYSMPTNFARDFHKQFGITPSQYMADNRPSLSPRTGKL